MYVIKRLCTNIIANVLHARLYEVAVCTIRKNYNLVARNATETMVAPTVGSGVQSQAVGFVLDIHGT
jgi:hypothetical protein